MKVPETQRKFLNEFAKSKHFDPLDAKSWYSITIRQIIQAGGNEILKHNEGSLINALIRNYPELSLNRKFFSSNERMKAPERQRKFFDEFAKFNNFDPLDAEKWSSVTRQHIIERGGYEVLKHYGGSHIKALTVNYPELNLKRSSFFMSEEQKQMRSVESQRNFLEEYAKEKRFDPLDIEMWHSVKKSDIMMKFGGPALLYHHNGSMLGALSHVYPDLQLKKEYFSKHSEVGWKNLQQQRKFFQEFAKCHRFDPLEIEKWESFSERDIRKAGGGQILNFYKGSFKVALETLYPELHFPTKR